MKMILRRKKTMRTIEGVELPEEAIKEFQESFVGSSMAALVGAVLQRVMMEGQESLTNMGMGEAGLRQAQGIVAAVRRFDEITLAIQNVNLEEDEETTGEDEDIGGVDVRF